MLCSYGGLSAYHNVPVVYSGEETSLGAGELCWRAIERGLQVSVMDKQNTVDLFRLFTVVSCISSHFDRVPASFFNVVLYEQKHIT